MKKEQTIYEALKNSATLYPKATALIYQHHKFSYAHVLNKVNALAYSLNANGVKKDDVITLLLPNIPMAVYLLYAINQIGAIANLVHPLITPTQLKEIMNKTKSKMAFIIDMNIRHFASLENLGVRLFAVSPVFELNPFVRLYYRYRYQRNLNEEFAYSLIRNKKLTNYDTDYQKDAFYLHSGGTTGKAKTIALSSFAINAVAISGLKILNIDNPIGVGMFSTLPMFHGFGLCMGIHASIMHGAFNVLIPKFKTKITISYLKRGQLQTLIGVPILYEALLKNKHFKGKNLSKVLNAFVGGDYASESLINRFNKRMEEANARARLYEGYGLTETVTVCTVNIHTAHKVGSVGKPIPFVEVKAFANNKMLPPNEAGELYVSGETLMNGYRFDEEKLNPFYIDEHKTRWIKTGDYGKVDEEGYVYFIQRLKRIIKINGINVFPREIESAISKLPNVFECYLKRVDDEKHGSLMDLHLVVNNPVDQKTFNEEIKQLIKDKFGVYAVPKHIVYHQRLPKTLIGKINEQALKNEGN